MSKNLSDMYEIQEQLQMLISKGYGKLVNTILDNESKVYTKKGRLNKSGACRLLGCKPKDLDLLLNSCKEILGGGDEEEE